MLTVLTIALMLVGTSYAMWYKTLTINGTIKTGYVDAIFTNVNPYDDEIPEKDVSNVTAVLSQDAETMNVTLANAYPCINYTVEFDILNTGSIPVIINAINGVPIEACYTVGGNFTNAIGVQLHPGESVHAVMTIHLTNDCAQNSTYSFIITIIAVQWNEASV